MVRLLFPPTKSKSTNKNRFDEEFAVAKITRICDAIAAIYINSAHTNYQSLHFNTVNNTHSIRA